MDGKGLFYSRLMCRLLVLCVLFATNHAACADDYSHPAHAEALQLAREGKTEAALSQFRHLLELMPQDRRLRYDYIVTLQWAGRNEEAIEQVKHIQLGQAPIFVLAALGKAARNTQQFDFAIQCYRNALRQDTSHLQSTLGLALALADVGRADEAVQILQPRAESDPANLPLWEALAYVYMRKRDWFRSLAAYEHILKRDASHRGARRGRIMVTSKMGAPHLALSMTEAAGDLVTDSEMDRLLADRAAVTIRWGKQTSSLYEKRQRVQDVDKAIKYLDHNLARFRQEPGTKSVHIANTQFDQLVALRDRERMLDVVHLYEQLLEQKVEFTSYALVAAADAYLYLEQPRRARDLYLQALEIEPDNFYTRFSLFFAYVEAEQFDKAFQIIDSLNASQVPWQDGSPNENKLTAESTAIAARAYGNLLEEAEHRLTPLHKRAPHNTELRNLLAYIYMWRGWNLRALDEFNIVLAADPEHLGAKIGRARAYFNLRKYRIVEQSLQELLSEHPENKHVLEAWRLWGIHNRRELRVDITKSRSDGVINTSDDQTIDTYLYSQPLDYNYRVFLHDYRAKATVVEGDVDYRRAGFGVEYRQPRWKVVGEVTRDYWFGGDEGYGLRADWTPDDHWQVELGYDSHAIDLPLRARFYAITARSVNFDLGYRVSDTRDFGFSMQAYDFSDGNNRNTVAARYAERLYTQPHFKTDGIFRLYASRNSKTDVPYFSPHRDHSFEYTFDNEWLTYREYSFRFYQRLALTLGRYYQDGFSGENIWAVQYEHDWNIDDELQMLYGVTRSRPVYDGVDELTTAYYLTFVWRF